MNGNSNSVTLEKQKETLILAIFKFVIILILNHI